ncbi:MAG: type II toxin-antitoxin system mRNA interferase toxin, RelE/StbE family [Patescibacteria group bacterium]
MKIIYTAKFSREYKKLSREIKISAEQAEAVFRKNPFTPSLDAHKLHGRFKDFWSFSIGFKHRIIFEFDGSKTVYFHSIGNHSIYQ